jgi:hypothetical protein
VCCQLTPRPRAPEEIEIQGDDQFHWAGAPKSPGADIRHVCVTAIATNRISGDMQALTLTHLDSNQDPPT